MLKETLIFSGGAVIGAAIAYLVTKRYYEKRNDEELAATKEFYESQDDFSHVVIAHPIDETEENERKEEETYHALVGKYSKPSDISTYVRTMHPELLFEILDPNENDPNDGLYEQVTLQYYEGDGVLTDINDEIIDDVEASIGRDALDHFGEFGEEDIVRVRNNKLKIDYEVIRLHANYVDYN